MPDWKLQQPYARAWTLGKLKQPHAHPEPPIHGWDERDATASLGGAPSARHRRAEQSLDLEQQPGSMTRADEQTPPAQGRSDFLGAPRRYFATPCGAGRARLRRDASGTLSARRISVQPAEM